MKGESLQDEYSAGQRWISETEPELGLGTIVEVDGRMVRIQFSAGGDIRQYARRSAPIKRVRFRPGDTIRGKDDSTFTVETVVEDEGLLIYQGEGRQLEEKDLSDSISFSKPQERLLAGQVDPGAAFDLRYESLLRRQRLRQSDVRGFLGGRIDLIPHQLYVAHEVSSRQAPRVLLADGVGLGKTIEACLILHRLLSIGQAKRALVLAPEALVHQWLVELRRRFNLHFSLLDEERCLAIEEAEPEANPFLDRQLVLASVEFLASDENRLHQATQAGWDVLIVDEAHRLGWTPQSPSAPYEAVRSLAEAVPSLLLLTATPEQLGPESHFARLRLLDPVRYSDLEQFLRESEAYHAVARIAGCLEGNQSPSREDLAFLTESEPELAARIEESADEESHLRLLAELLDRHGPGRVMFRNTRSVLSGYPSRVERLHRLPAACGDESLAHRLAIELAADIEERAPVQALDFSHDPRVDWLGRLLLKRKEEKVLLICNSQAKVEAIEEALRHRFQFKSALFHEGLSLVQRDRNAAWFADPKGAQILLCSEIGSEGRNFQFAQRLVLFDLPFDPELLEQRIGRLDRIGQTGDVRIHVPFGPDSGQEAIARWYSEGLDAFEQSLNGGYQIAQTLGDRLKGLALSCADSDPASESDVEAFLGETRRLRDSMAQRLEQGRDRLLELASFRPSAAERLIERISIADRDAALDSYAVRLFEHYGVSIEELSPRTYLLKADHLFTEAFPSLPEGGLSVTCDRALALKREDIEFFSWDHPMLEEVMGLLLGTERGNSAFAIWEEPEPKGILLEAVHILECVAPRRMGADRFLPPTPIRVVVDHMRQDRSQELPREELLPRLVDGQVQWLLEKPEISQKIFPKMVAASRWQSKQRIEPIVQEALARMRTSLGSELQRLSKLRSINDHVRREEIEQLAERIEALNQVISSARLRLDSLRLIWRGPKDLAP